MKSVHWLLLSVCALAATFLGACKECDPKKDCDCKDSVLLDVYQPGATCPGTGGTDDGTAGKDGGGPGVAGTGGSGAKGGAGPGGSGGADVVDPLPENFVGIVQTSCETCMTEVSVPLPEGVVPELVTVFFFPDGSDSAIVVASEAKDGAVTFSTQGAGKYVVTELQLTPPDGCAPKAVQGNQNLTKPADVAALASVTEIQGSLTISGTVADLSPLACLTHVNGNLAITNNNVLEAASLPGLKRVARQLSVLNDRILEKVHLPELKLVGAWDLSLHLSDLPELLSVDAPNLVGVPSHVSLTSLGGTAEEPLELDFSSLSTIGGNLAISSNETLENLAKLTKLASVGGRVVINSNSALTSLNGLAGLKRAGLDMTIVDDSHLESVDLSSLELVGAHDLSLRFENLPELVTLRAGKLRETPAHISLTSLGGTADEALTLDFSSLAIVRGSLNISSNERLEDLDQLSRLAQVEGNLQLDSNPNLSNLDGLENLEMVTREITIAGNRSLTRIDLRSLTKIGAHDQSLYFENLPELLLLDASKLEEAPSDVVMANLGDTADGDLKIDLSALSIVRGTLSVTGNENLVELDSLAKLREVEGMLVIQSNPNLESLEGLRGLEIASREITIHANALLESINLSALHELGAHDQSLYVNDLPALHDLDVSALDETPSDIILTNLGDTAEEPLALAFDALAIVRGNLQISSSGNLESLAGFRSLRRVEGAFTVTSNPNLPSCEATRLAERIEITRATTISGNAACE